jgi:hypothetical protein
MDNFLGEEKSYKCSVIRSLFVLVMMTSLGFLYAREAYAMGTDQFPSLEVGKETARSANKTMGTECIDLVQKILPPINFVNTHLSINPIWGPVWRGDFEFSHDGAPDSRFVNRVVCWRLPNGKISMMIGIGQQLQPLPKDSD